MENIKSRLKIFLKHLEMGQNKFEAHVGIANGYIASKSVTVASDILEKIKIKYPELNIEWLVTGQGEMLRDDHSVTQIGDGNNINAVGKNSIKVGIDAEEMRVLKARNKELESLVEELRVDKKFLQELLTNRKIN
jgi:hypothetical protein